VRGRARATPPLTRTPHPTRGDMPTPRRHALGPPHPKKERKKRKKVYATWAYVKEGAQLTGKPALQLPTIGKERALWPKGVFDLGVLAYVWCG
jgi:hypothetical protein